MESTLVARLLLLVHVLVTSGVKTSAQSTGNCTSPLIVTDTVFRDFDSPSVVKACQGVWTIGTDLCNPDSFVRYYNCNPGLCTILREDYLSDTPVYFRCEAQNKIYQFKTRPIVDVTAPNFLMAGEVATVVTVVKAVPRPDLPELYVQFQQINRVDNTTHEIITVTVSHRDVIANNYMYIRLHDFTIPRTVAPDNTTVRIDITVPEGTVDGAKIIDDIPIIPECSIQYQPVLMRPMESVSLMCGLSAVSGSVRWWRSSRLCGEFSNFNCYLGLCDVPFDDSNFYYCCTASSVTDGTSVLSLLDTQRDCHGIQVCTDVSMNSQGAVTAFFNEPVQILITMISEPSPTQNITVILTQGRTQALEKNVTFEYGYRNGIGAEWVWQYIIQVPDFDEEVDSGVLAFTVDYEHENSDCQNVTTMMTTHLNYQIPVLRRTGKTADLVQRDTSTTILTSMILSTLLALVVITMLVTVCVCIKILRKKQNQLQELREDHYIYSVVGPPILPERNTNTSCELNTNPSEYEYIEENQTKNPAYGMDATAMSNQGNRKSACKQRDSNAECRDAMLLSSNAAYGTNVAIAPEIDCEENMAYEQRDSNAECCDTMMLLSSNTAYGTNVAIAPEIDCEENMAYEREHYL